MTAAEWKERADLIKRAIQLIEIAESPDDSPLVEWIDAETARAKFEAWEQKKRAAGAGDQAATEAT